MYRTGSLVLGLFLLTVPTPAADLDPEPPPSRGTVKSGDYTIKTDKNGNVTASNKDGAAWKVTLRGTGDDVGQVVVAGDRVVVAREGVQAALELRSGKMYWQRSGGLTKAALTVNGDLITLTAGKSQDVLDLRTGKLLKSVR